MQEKENSDCQDKNQAKGGLVVEAGGQQLHLCVPYVDYTKPALLQMHENLVVVSYE